LDYVSFMVTGGIAALFHPRPDVIVTTSPQFLRDGRLGGHAASLPWVFELRDLWPASIVAVGAMKELGDTAAGTHRVADVPRCGCSRVSDSGVQGRSRAARR
jgi:hypothetical protein